MMIDDLNRPDDDRDERMARRIGANLEAGDLERASGPLEHAAESPESAAESPENTAESPEDVPFYRSLIALKRDLQDDATPPSKEASRRMWKRVEAAITEDKPADRKPVRGVHRSPDARRRSAASWVWVSAAVLMAGLVTMLLLRSPDAVLVASAGADVLDYTAADGSVVTLRPHSELRLVEESANVLRFRLDGEAYFAVAPRDDRTFLVEGGEALVRVLGTRFNLSTWGGRAAVYLEEGRLRFEHVQSRSSVVLEPGHWSRTTEAGTVLAPVAHAPDEHLDWLRGEMIFRQRSLYLVLAELEQHFGIRLDAPGPSLDETLSGRILLLDERQSLDDLGLVMGGRFVETGPAVFRFDPD